MMKPCLSAFLIIMAFANASFSQERAEGRVLKAMDDLPVPYVNIGIVDYKVGTVSDADGYFSLPYRSESDSVLFSAIGFSSKKVSVRELVQNPLIHLEQRTYTMEEITVTENALSELRELGYNLKKRRQSIGFGSTQLGTEIGARIRIDRETVIEKAFFTFNRAGGDSLLFRVNLYEFEGDKPGSNLIPENVLLLSPESGGTVSIDLSAYNIVTDKDLLLSLEWVDAVSLAEDEIQGIAFRADENRRGSNTYLKSTSFAPFIKTDAYVKYRLGFYLTVRQVE